MRGESEINSIFSKVNDKKYIIKYFHKGLKANMTLVFIFILIIFLQCILVTHGSVTFHCYKWYDDATGGAGLNPNQWLICVGFGMGSLVVGFILKCIPEEKDLDVKNFLNKEKNLKFFYFSLGLKKKKRFSLCRRTI